MKCPRCRRAYLVEIDVTLNGRNVTMHSCSRCDSRWWDSEGEKLPLPNVLEMAAPRR